MKKISVIIPMYNAERTIEECLDSLVNQTIFEEMELLIVDDFSKDNCVRKVVRYEHDYSDRILLICLDENKGPGNARNVAMQYATGEYIGFVDSDDAVYPRMYEKLYDEAKRTNADYVDCGFYDQKKDTAIVFTSDDLKGRLDDSKRSGLIVSGGYIWSKIFRRSFILSENIVFRNEYVLEDMDYLIEVFAKAKINSNVKEILYIYRDSADSLSKTTNVDKYFNSAVTAMKAVYEKTSGLACYEGIQESVEYTILQLYSYAINLTLKCFKEKTLCKKKAESFLKELQGLRKMLVKGDYENPYVKSKINSYDISIMEKNDISPEKIMKLVNSDCSDH